MKSILIIGMGMLGQCLATRMQELGNDVMVIDRDEDKIQELSTVFPDALSGDCTNPAVLKWQYVTMRQIYLTISN